MAFYNLALMHATGAGVMRSCNTATEVIDDYDQQIYFSDFLHYTNK